MTDAEVETIVAYLAAFYGRDPAPAPAPDTLASASDDPIAKLLAANACTSCHDVAQKLVGPAFREVAQKYSGDAGAAARLAEKNARRRERRLGSGADAAECGTLRARFEAPRRMGADAEVRRRSGTVGR